MGWGLVRISPALKEKLGDTEQLYMLILGAVVVGALAASGAVGFSLVD
jgi:hypothetical protein